MIKLIDRYGIEIVKDAVIDARANARMNNITNTSFMDGKVEELLPKLCSKEKADVIFVDTAGFSHKNETQRNDMRALLAGLSPEYEKSVYLVLSATTKYRDLISIIDSYKDIDDYKLIFTKLDETEAYGNIYNIKMYSGAPLSYMTNGQNVPDDIEEFNTQKIVKQLLGGR